MKCIAYVSKASNNDSNTRVPTGLSDIINFSRKHNPESQITGIISYREGQYLQVIEGPPIEVDKLMKRIATDPRHEDIWVFLDTHVAQRHFYSWSVSVFDFVDQGALFEAFIEDHKAILNNLDEQQKSRIKPFINLKKPDILPKKHYKDKNLRLLAWPDLNNVDDPKMMMDLCVKLTKKPYAFNALVNSGEFGTADQITKIISNFEQSGILSVTEPTPSDTQTVNEKKPNKFYSAIKKFLGMG